MGDFLFPFLKASPSHLTTTRLSFTPSSSPSSPEISLESVFEFFLFNLAFKYYKPFYMYNCAYLFRICAKLQTAKTNCFCSKLAIQFAKQNLPFSNSSCKSCCRSFVHVVPNFCCLEWQTSLIARFEPH